MNKLVTAAAVLALLPVVCEGGSAATGGFSPDAGGGRAIVLAGGMGGGAGGMGGGGGGMGGGATGMGGGAFGMGGGGGHFGGGMFGGPTTDFDRPAVAAPSDNPAPADNYTYQCVTPAGRCSFVAPAALRANSLRSGADCGCGGGQPQGRIE